MGGASTSAAITGHAGRWLVDDSGRVVVLHGVNLVNKLPPYHPAAIGFDAEDARFLSGSGFNAVRLGIIWKALEREPGSYDRSYLERIAATVAELREEGIHVLLDFHQDMWNERFNGEGAPDWAVQDDGLRPWPNVGFPGNYAVMRALWRAYDHFWANDAGVQDRYAAAWRHVAGRFRDEPAVFGYDIFNEPFPGSRAVRSLRPGGDRGFDRQLSDFNARVLRAIRTVDERKLVFFEPNVLFDYGADCRLADSGDGHTGLSFHCYCLAASPGLPRFPAPAQDRVCGRQEQRVHDLAEHHSRRTGDALLLSEFGATDDLHSLERSVSIADGNMVSWQYWAYFGRDPCCERPKEGLVHDLGRPPEGSNVKQAKLDVLARPYPRAVAGTPARYGFDPPTRRFELEHTTVLPSRGRADGLQTEVFVPQRHYPAGYRVEVEGGSVASGPGELCLRLAPDREAAHVRVTVVPA
jgi:endoglycosylceramidase